MDDRMAVTPVSLGLNPGSTTYQFLTLLRTLTFVIITAPIPQLLEG